jgi:hypothetical protein
MRPHFIAFPFFCTPKLLDDRCRTIKALFGLLTGGSMTQTGCNTGNKGPALTPAGICDVRLNMTGPNGALPSISSTFAVSAGVAGQL